ncbi:FAD-NAD(P)-binding protein [Leeuwenhoekiella aestuarii]|uniref:FAD-NAD(P)-binding protein n=1 Tax=Leeuwenhoekiella aestuarii TaxID=2249426 RepID=A0A4Q0NW41_9FLAO|nr:FAD/NAD(P)-binding protein [Leeuwenhoekiella aestuarii]RXG15317.1 FAD-NAD(P)-binding protein [Leeuwenhoekiella aestuarii]RXG17576.1 FAD-NAD(P)-binding protein [Leeuwenhoekiella aestuarii]
MSKLYKIAIVGVGPRGLAALESLYLAKKNSNSSKKLKVVLFEASAYPGAGQIWTPNQVRTNLSNVHERNLSNNLAGREALYFDDVFIPEFPSYKKWLTNTDDDYSEKDVFPARAKLGSYLNERFNTFREALVGSDLVDFYQKEVIKIEPSETGCIVYTKDEQQIEVDEAVLTIGHQPTYDSKQLKTWGDHAEENNLKLYEDPYPVGALETDSISAETTVALRGFGLSMVDQVRALSIGFGGYFIKKENSIKWQYIPSEKAPKQLIAFSLNGLPPAPKPVSATIDNWFKPNAQEKQSFIRAIEKAEQRAASIKDASFLIEALADMTASVYIRMSAHSRKHKLSFQELSQLTVQLIKDADTAHELILEHDLPALEAMEHLLKMAFGKTAISLDYCLGQVWRFALGILYHDYTYLNLPDEAMVDVVNYIEASKRYSYGPPVKSLQQLIALVEAGVLNLDFVNNPTITPVENGWKLEKNNQSIIAQVMVNSVIDAPQLVAVSSPLIQNLLEDNRVDPVSYKLGLHTLEDGSIISKNGNSHQHISLLGRLAKGSIIGVDDLIECFGKPAHKWADSLIERL